MTDSRSREAVEATERVADGQIPGRELDLRSTAAEGAFEEAIEGSVARRAALAAFYASTPPLYRPILIEAMSAVVAMFPDNRQQELAAQAALLRDIFGNPFHKVKCKKTWQTDTTRALASQMYESRDFSAMPILADALQDVGCDNDDILNHCRQSGQHVRGCWVVDLVLGKE
jgi:hypothetical protein